MRGRISLLRYSSYGGKMRYTPLRQYKRNLFMAVVVVATIIIYVTTRFLARRPIHVLVRFTDHDEDIKEGFSVIFENHGFREHVEKKTGTRKVETKGTTRLMTSSTTKKLTIEHNDVISNERAAKWSLNPIYKCKNNPYLLILISSHESMTSSRDIIRKTWCKKKSFSGNRNVLCLFLLGQSEDAEETPPDVTKEYLDNRDVIKRSFPDNFRNSTRKFMMGLEWTKQYCPDVKYVMKTEDDVIVNTDIIMEKLLPKEEEKDYFVGKCWSDSPNRNPNSRFYVSEEEYPGDKYPVYCGRTGYIVSGDVTNRMYEAARREKQLPLDDVFAGVLLERIHVTPVDTPGFLLGRYDEDNNCTTINSAATIHAHGVDVQHVWDAMREKCR